jgi:hypothetical protein
MLSSKLFNTAVTEAMARALLIADLRCVVSGIHPKTAWEPEALLVSAVEQVVA